LSPVLLPGNNRSAANDCTAAHAIDPKNVKTYFRAAKALLALAQYPDALRWCDEGLELEPDNQTLIKVLVLIEARLYWGNVGG
jgi:tetratricopeptide (TPR) repeat protein